MGRRTISNLSREMKVSRPRIYRALERLGIEKKAGDEYPLAEWELLKKELATTSKDNKQKLTDADNVDRAVKGGSKKAKNEIMKSTKLKDVEQGTLRLRLQNAKQEYDYNRELIMVFQRETDEYAAMFGKTTMRTNNGTEAAIPSIVNLEKYIKLNISLSKLISDLEGDLDLEDGEEDDPFG